MLAVSTVFPYFQSGTPATDEYQETMHAYGKHVGRGVSSATGWVSSKLFEKGSQHDAGTTDV